MSHNLCVKMDSKLRKTHKEEIPLVLRSFQTPDGKVQIDLLTFLM